MKPVAKSEKLQNVCYDIRGPVLDEATRLEEEGHRVLKLNIGNPAPFGLFTPDEILQDVIANLPDAQGYCASKGLYSARKAVMQDCQLRGYADVEIDDIYPGNGVSELIVMAMQGLLNNGDEVLIPAPDYPLWTAAVSLCGGKPIHYFCDEGDDWQPNIEDIRSKITSNTRAIVVINPNNPTGAVYGRDKLEQIAELAREHQLIVCADEIYDRILYDGASHTPFATIANDILCLTFNGLSKSYRLAGFRSGWMIITGRKYQATDYVEGLNILSSMRLCANVPAQYAIQTALGGYQSIDDLVLPTGRLGAQRDIAYEKLIAIPGVSCVKPKGAIYLFPKLDESIYNIEDDEQFVLDLLIEQKILVVQGTAFNLPSKQHLRLVFLPTVDVLEDAIDRFAEFWKRGGSRSIDYEDKRYCKENAVVDEYMRFFNSITVWLSFYHNNYSANQLSLEQIERSHLAGAEWLVSHKELLFSTHNPALWEMLAKAADKSTDQRLQQLVTEYRNTFRSRYRGHPLDFQIFGYGSARYENLDLSTFPYYNLFMMYGYSCDKSLAQLATVEDQKQLDFCDRYYPISPACKTHQLYGFTYLLKNNCEDAEYVKEAVSHLSRDIRRQLWFDVRQVDVYLQRVLMLLEVNRHELIRQSWMHNIILAQNSDGGWDNFMPLVKLGKEKSFGIGSKSFKISHEKSDFHATVQGTLLTAYAIEKLFSSLTQ